MKTKTLILSIIIAIMALLTGSCNKWLDVKPRSVEPADTMFDTYFGYRTALTGCYMKMKHQSLWGEQLTMTVVEYLAQHWQVAETNAFKQHHYDDDGVKGTFENIYLNLYNTIVQANTIIDAIPRTGETAILDPQARGVVAGEAYAIRALCHFEILRLFGQVPTANPTEKRNLPYTDQVSHEPATHIDYESFIGKIESDLNKAAELLKQHDPIMDLTVTQVNNATVVRDEYLRFRLHRLNYFAVKALQARFYLYIGNPEKANIAANEVIAAAEAGKGFSLATNAANLNSRYFALPGESLFMLSSHQLTSYYQNLFPTTPGRVMLHMTQDKIQGSDQTFGMFGELYSGAVNNRLRDVWLLKLNQQGVQVFVLQKYCQENASSMSPLNQMLNKHVIPLLRLSEMYLIAMETTNDLEEINRLYDDYRRARNIAASTAFTDKEEVMDLIEKEYRREFFAEGQMFFFYKRNNARRMEWTTPIDKEISELSYIIPLPMTELTLNRP